MRPSHVLAALGATTLAQAQDTSPNPEDVAQATQDCTTSPTTTWTLPSVSASSTHPASYTVTIDHSPGNGTTTGASSAASATTPPEATTTSSPSVSPSSSVAAAAAPGEGLPSDSSMLGLVVFFALSLCLL